MKKPKGLIPIEADRLKILRKAETMTQQEFGEALNLKQSTIQRYESGEYPIPGDIVKLLVEKFHLSIDWFYFGRGEMKMSSKDTKTLKEKPSDNTALLELRIEKLETIVRALEKKIHELTA